MRLLSLRPTVQPHTVERSERVTTPSRRLSSLDHWPRIPYASASVFRLRIECAKHHIIVTRSRFCLVLLTRLVNPLCLVFRMIEKVVWITFTAWVQSTLHNRVQPVLMTKMPCGRSALISPVSAFYKKYFKDVSREFDEFRVNTHLCKLRCWCL